MSSAVIILEKGGGTFHLENVDLLEIDGPILWVEDCKTGHREGYPVHRLSKVVHCDENVLPEDVAAKYGIVKTD